MRRAIVIAGSAALLAALVIADAHGPLRVAAALWFVLACPGLAIVPLLPNVSRAAEVPLTIAVSLAAGIAVAAAQLSVGSYSPAGALLALSGICAAGCTLQWRRQVGSAPATEIRLYS